MANKKSKTLFRADVSRGASGVKNDGTIIGFSVITKGPIPSHDAEADDETLDQVVKLGKRSKIGIKSRFGHPNMSSTALGTYLGRAKNFRRDGDQVRADLHFDQTAYDTPEGDLASYVQELAKSDPEAFGSSMVFDGAFVPQLDEKGERKKDDEGNQLPDLVRVDKLFAVDAVDDPAANEGLFSSQRFAPNVELSAAASQFLDKFLQDPDAVEKVTAFLGRYSANNGPVELRIDGKAMTKEEIIQSFREAFKDYEFPKKEAAMPDEPTTQATESQVDEQALQARVDEAVKNERERLAKIADAARILGASDDLAKKARDEDWSYEKATESFLGEYDGRNQKRLTELQKDSVPDVGPNLGEEDVPNEPPDGHYDKEYCKARWSALPADERASYESFEIYEAYIKNAARHRTHVAAE